MTDKLRILPPQLLSAINRLDYSKLYEIRVRSFQAVRVFYADKFFYLGKNGALFSDTKGKSLSDFVVLTQSQVAEIVLRAAEFSIYAVNGQISSGFVTIAGGIRVGIAGEVVYEGGDVKTQKAFSSLVIRIPHQILGCADSCYAALKANGGKNLLLISPPGCGKTTILRDLARRISDDGANTLLVDERNELAASHQGVATLDVGRNTDIISAGRKDFAFSFGIRCLRPDYIVTDELAGKSDIQAVTTAALSGVSVIASIHAHSLFDIQSRQELAPIIANKIFDVYVFLSLKRGAGTVEKILDKDLKAV